MRILFCAGEGIGNIIMATSAIVALKELKYEIDLLLHPTPFSDVVCELFNDPQYVDFVSVHDSVYDAIDYDYVFETFWFAFSPIFIRNLNKTNIIRCDSGFSFKESETEHTMNYVRQSFGYNKPTPRPYVCRDLNFKLGLYPKTLGMHCGCKANWKNMKQWKGFAEVAERFENVVAFWGPEDNINDFKWPNHVNHITGLSLPQVASAISECAVFISNDSGIMHVAHAVGVPTLGIFGSGSPAKSMSATSTLIPIVSKTPPSCQFCYPKNGPVCPYKVECLSTISVDVVEKQVRSVLNNEGVTSSGLDSN